MPQLVITHWDIVAFLVVGLVGYLIGFTHGRFLKAVEKLNSILTVRRRAKK